MTFNEFIALDLEKRFSISQEEAWKKTHKKRSTLNEIKSSKLHNIYNLFRIQRILRPLKNFETWHRHLDIPCSQCGQKTICCGYIDVGGGVEYYDHFWHICLNCLNASFLAKRTGLGQDEDENTNCPFCGHHW